MLNSFYVRCFRSFSELDIPRLGRVNLIVGKNSVGKTTLLEALWLYAARMRPEALHHLLVARADVLTEQDPESREIEVDVKALFFGRNYLPELQNEIVLGPSQDARQQISMRITWVERILSSEPAPPSYVELREEDADTAEGDVFPALRMNQGDSEQFFVRRYDSWFRSLGRYRYRPLEAMAPFLRAGNVDSEMIGRWWDSVALTESEERIVSCLNLLVPVERLTLVEHPRRHGTRVFVVRLKDELTPQPLKSLGDGVERVFHTALAIEYARRRLDERKPEIVPSTSDGVGIRNILLMDEIESGVHYSAIADYWRLIFQLAHQLDVQVFATTHSWDCVEGFQQAATENVNTEGMLIRLERQDSSCRAVVVDERDLAIVTRDNIEIR